MNSSRPAHGHDRSLDLRVFLDVLVTGGHITVDELEAVVASRRGEVPNKMHPLAWIAEQDLDDRKNPGKKLDIETLTQKLATLAGQPYYRIDPLSIDAAKVTEVMSYAFTQRHKIMALEVSATDEPRRLAEQARPARLTVERLIPIGRDHERQPRHDPKQDDDGAHLGSVGLAPDRALDDLVDMEPQRQGLVAQPASDLVSKCGALRDAGLSPGDDVLPRDSPL